MGGQNGNFTKNSKNDQPILHRQRFCWFSKSLNGPSRFVRNSIEINKNATLNLTCIILDSIKSSNFKKKLLQKYPLETSLGVKPNFLPKIPNHHLSSWNFNQILYLIKLDVLNSMKLTKSPNHEMLIKINHFNITQLKRFKITKISTTLIKNPH